MILKEIGNTSKVSVLINGLGSTPLMELYIMYKKVDEILDNKDKIKVLTKKISKLKKIKKDYFLNNSKYLFEYFENKQEINKNTNKKTLSNFFTNSNVETNTKKTQSVIYKYLKNVNSKHINLSNYITDIDICKSCNKGELIPVSHEGILICNHCSKNYRFLILLFQENG